ncbi:platelet-activating factor acetylhydrolase, isoform II-domain-containing protein [Lentinula edodes]|uniref:platelet-activating factor acetylhydrolase, isoform II-domain-containing protein n=1 Tax=Lentinula edodes TaxID=5353 RepID=UPI001E8E6471|nr:platelet-activating factor acetylhydrolase, isoform II-domain-containing protein [Lentinula edodes]KAH7876864.1 platelet-activating factor acetylhydrolase, isoform II-domain-containing protein [Lentinula edodes]
MLFLKDPNGLHPVGATRCLVPLEKPIIAGDAKILGQEDVGLRLEEVSFTIFYPTHVPPGDKRYKKGLRWLTGPLQTEITGLGHFAGVSRWMIWLILAPFLYAYGQFIKIPVYEDAPLLYPSEEGAKWPLVIFSHGLGGSPTTYSQLCVRLAASGKIVVAVEHRDGTMPSCFAPYNGRNRRLLYIRESEVSWAEKPRDVLQLRLDQLSIRQHEIYTTYAAFAKLVCSSNKDNNFGAFVHFVGDLSREPDFQETWSNAPIDVEDVCLAGHSFGGCTVFSILSSMSPIAPGGNTYSRIPVRDTLILDPWLEPLPSPGPTPYSGVGQGVTHDNATVAGDQFNGDAEDGSGHIGSRLLVINSEAFTLWTSHFERLKETVKGWGPDAKLVTLLQSAHTSFSDYHVFPLIGNKAGAHLMDVISKLSLAFLNNPSNNWLSESELKSTADILYRMPEKIVIGKWKDGRNRHRLVGEVGQVVVH